MVLCRFFLQHLFLWWRCDQEIRCTDCLNVPMIQFEPPSSPPAAASQSGPALALSKSGLTRFLHRAQLVVGVTGQVGVLLAGDGTLKRLNRAYRGKNKATDVLSFPAPSVEDGGEPGIAGDIAISLDTAAKQAEEFGHTLRDEVRVLLLHGLLHLHGMDHEADGGEMAAREGELQRKLRLPLSLTGRAEAGQGRGKSQ